MRDLAKLVGCGWLGLVFYGAGSLNSGRQFAIAGAVLVVSCGLAAALGVGRTGRGVRPTA